MGRSFGESIELLEKIPKIIGRPPKTHAVGVISNSNTIGQHWLLLARRLGKIPIHIIDQFASYKFI